MNLIRTPARRTAVLLLTLAFAAQACSAVGTSDSPSSHVSRPSAGETPGASTTAQSPSAESPSADPTTSSVDVTWEAVSLPADGSVQAFGGMSDSTGWFVVGEVCPSVSCVGRIWRSDDGRTWRTTRLPDADRVLMTAITRRGDEYFAAGDRCVPVDNGPTGETTGFFWRSTDGDVWESIGSIDLGRLDEACTEIEHLAAGDAGLVATLSTGRRISSAALRSTDGATWNELPQRALGLQPPYGLEPTDMVAVDPAGTILTAGCFECPVALWNSDDGSTWTELGRIDEPHVIGLSLAGGPGLVLAAWVCLEAPCHTSLWFGGGDEPFRRVRDDLLLDRPHVASAGEAYLLVGRDSRDVSVGHLHAFASIDGISWVEVSADNGQDDCTARELIGGASGALFLGDGGCPGMWLVDVAAS